MSGSMKRTIKRREPRVEVLCPHCGSLFTLNEGTHPSNHPSFRQRLHEVRDAELRRREGRLTGLDEVRDAKDLERWAEQR